MFSLEKEGLDNEQSQQKHVFMYGYCQTVEQQTIKSHTRKSIIHFEKDKKKYHDQHLPLAY